MEWWCDLKDLNGHSRLRCILLDHWFPKAQKWLIKVLHCLFFGLEKGNLISFLLSSKTYWLVSSSLLHSWGLHYWNDFFKPCGFCAEMHLCHSGPFLASLIEFAAFSQLSRCFSCQILYCFVLRFGQVYFQLYLVDLNLSATILAALLS